MGDEVASIKHKGETKKANLAVKKTIAIKLKKHTSYQAKTYLIPLGVPDYNGNVKDQYIKFEVDVIDSKIKSYFIDIFHDGNVIYTSSEITVKLTGKSIYEWDGFDNNGILDSEILKQGKKLKAQVRTNINGTKLVKETKEFYFKYPFYNWTDVKINKNTKRIDVTLRVNLTDGGAKGLKCTTLPWPIGTKCPWDDIPTKTLSLYGKTRIIKSRKSYKQLLKLALDGLNYHWGRNRNHFMAKNVKIGSDVYEIYVNAVNATTSSMDSVELIFKTNGDMYWARSRNPGTATNLPSLVAQPLGQMIYYNVGYMEYSNGWDYIEPSKADDQFQHTAAHEIGHEILKAYGGDLYSFQHKGTSYLAPQDTVPLSPTVTDNYTHLHDNNIRGESYPMTGEIDLMKYYNDNKLGNIYAQKKYFQRSVAAEKDVLSLIWLSKCWVI